MTKIKFLIIPTIVIGSLVSCVNKEIKECSTLFSDATTLYNNNSLNQASVLLDSLHSTFPNKINFRLKADTLQWKIDKCNYTKNYNYLDSMIPSMQDSINILLNQVKYEKSKYEDLGRYVPKYIKIEDFSNKDGLYPYCNEHGKRYIQSFSINSKSFQNQIKASIGTVFIETNPTPSTSIHNYKDLGIWHHTVLIEESELNGIFDFIAHSKTNQKIRINLNNTKKYFLPRKSLKAFFVINKLAHLLQVKKEMLEHKTLLEHKIKHLNIRLSSSITNK